ncbi:hypothetical protein CKALI_00395 [Corynebacterium kalinowskii]|uniref:Uncharacterized protein n=1 Tax=Corynebacterium kalinowskii TaxID=2675216 RepID=A0A6B8VUN1_9CORY|nr:hypothetical protein CKALI_00395 [Corynebacterium kalinowskii]
MINNIPEIGPVTYTYPFLFTTPIHLPIVSREVPFAIDPTATESDRPALMSAIINFRSLSLPEFRLRTEDLVLAANYAWSDLTFDSHPVLCRRDQGWEVAWECGPNLVIALIDGNRHPHVRTAAD